MNGERFEVLETRVCWGEERVYFIGRSGRVERMRLNWTSLVAPDPFIETSAGRSAFRASDLLALADLVASLLEDGS